MKKVLVAMSGGVDSTVAVKLLQNQGYEVAGATMKLLSADGPRVEKTRALAESMGARFYVFDFTSEFKNEVIDAFARAYTEGLTPNPCVVCNQRFKFGRFLDEALALGYDYVATGHYARIEQDGARYLLKTASDPLKDQSYFVYGLTQRELAHVVFPLADMEKDEIRRIAVSLGLDNAHQKDSQDICFVEGGKYMEIVENYCAENNFPIIPGKFVDLAGKTLGRHLGIEKYTIGQRKGVGVALGGEKPMYVISKNPVRHEVVMGPDEVLFSREMLVENVSWVDDAYKSRTRAEVKPRYAKRPLPATLELLPDESVRVVFDEPVRAITPGQYAVFYDGENVLGGGEILG